MCRDDGADDREAESVAVLRDHPASIEALERLEKALNFVGRDLLSCIAYR